MGADQGQIQSLQDMSEVQAILQHAGYLEPGGYRKGENDDATQQAVQSFESNHGLSPTGSVDYETMTQLLGHQGTNDQDRVADRTYRAPLFGHKRSLVLEGVTFDNDTAHLTLRSRATLDRVAQSLNSQPDVRVEVAGHTDSRNTDAYNLKLSEARSAAVCAYLVDQGVASSRLKEMGFGESNPIADNKTAAGRATNRRVELIRLD
jgi:outer membrane protein OmpA-like peptidoglycan-associated protein